MAVVHLIFAYIKGDTIKNIAVVDNYELANQQARAIYGSEAMAVECTQYACSVGDIYRDGIFYFKDNETAIPRQNTAEEDAEEAKTIAQTAAANVDYISMLAGVEL